FVDRGIELHSRITTNVRAFSDLSQESAGVLPITRLPVPYPSGPPFATFCCRLHERVADPDAQVFVLVHDRAVSVAVITSVVALFDQGPGFSLFVRLGIDELFDIRVPIL